MVAISRPETGGKLRCWSYFAKSPSELFAGFVIARNRQDAEFRANAKAKERQGVLVKLARFSDCEVDTLLANGVLARENPYVWLSPEEFQTVWRSALTAFGISWATKYIQFERQTLNAVKAHQQKE